MVDLAFDISGVEVEKFSAAPLLTFFLRIANLDAARRVENISLNCQIRIEPAQRAYSPRERERLGELFGAPERWGDTLHSVLWTHASISIPRFDGETVARLPAFCTHDFNVASAKYFYGLVDGEVPLSFLFSGSIFYKDASGALQIAQIPWSKEARYRLPVGLWAELMNQHYPDGELLRVGADTFDRLYRFKRLQGLLTFDEALDRLLREMEVDAS
jgi:hypothetical protein